MFCLKASINFNYPFKVKVKVKIPLEQATNAQRGSGGMALSLFSTSALERRVVSAKTRPPCPGKDPVPIVQEVGWVPGPVWTEAGNLVPTGIRSPAGPARSQSLCSPGQRDTQTVHVY